MPSSEHLGDFKCPFVYLVGNVSERMPEGLYFLYDNIFQHQKSILLQCIYVSNVYESVNFIIKMSN